MDFETVNQAKELLSQLDPSQCRVKIGKELFAVAGPDLVRDVVSDGFDVFLDLKFHDIPNTVARAVRVAADLGVPRFRAGRDYCTSQAVEAHGENIGMQAAHSSNTATAAFCGLIRQTVMPKCTHESGGA